MKLHNYCLSEQLHCGTRPHCFMSSRQQMMKICCLSFRAKISLETVSQPLESRGQDLECRSYSCWLIVMHLEEDEDFTWPNLIKSSIVGPDRVGSVIRLDWETYAVASGDPSTHFQVGSSSPSPTSVRPIQTWVLRDIRNSCFKKGVKNEISGFISQSSLGDWHRQLFHDKSWCKLIWRPAAFIVMFFKW